MAKPAQNIRPKQGEGSLPSGGSFWSRLSIRSRLAVFLCVVVFCVYANGVGNGFAVDDYVMVVNNSMVTKGIKGIPELLVTPHQRGNEVIANDEYRPLPMVLLAIEYQFFDNDASLFHVVNLLLFAICVVVLFYMLDRLFDGRRTRAAFVAAMLFALHPIHTEVVDNIKSCDELLSFLFAFLSLGAFMRHQESGRVRDLLAGGSLMLLSFLSKESTLTFLAIIPMALLILKGGDRKRGAMAIGTTVLAIAVFMTLRFSVLNYYHANNMGTINLVENALAGPAVSISSRLATAFLILGYYAKLLFIPYPLCCDYSFNTIPITTFGDVRVILSIAVYAFLGILAVARMAKDRRDPYAFGIAFFLITLSIVSNIVVLIKSTMGERFLFIPSVGLCLVAGLLYDAACRKRDKASVWGGGPMMYVLGLVGLAFAGIIISRNGDWKDNYTLYSADLKKAPENCRLNYYVGYQIQGMAYGERDPQARNGMLRDVVRYYRKAIDIDTAYSFASGDLGGTYFSLRQPDSAIYYDLLALRQTPEMLVVRNNLSGVYINYGMYDKAVKLGHETIRLLPGNINGYADMGAAYMNLKQYDSAIYYLNRSKQIDPSFFETNAVLALVYNALGYADSVRKYEFMAQQANPAFRVGR